MDSTSTQPAAAAGPVAPRGRIATLDILRGFSLLGMILAHFYKTMGEGAAAGGASWIEWGITMGVAEKDRAVFAFLFGVSFAVMLHRLEARNLPVVAIFLRRLFMLYLLGFALESLTRFSILREYALWGVPLLLLRKYNTRTLLVLALLSAAAFSIRDLVDSGHAVVTLGHEGAVAAEREQLQQWEEARRWERENMAGAGYAQVVAWRFDRIVREIPTLYHLTPTINLALFILGLLAVRHGIFEAPLRHRRLILGFMAIGLLIWVADWWLLPLLPADFATPRIALRLHGGLGVVDEQLLAFTYIGAVTLLLANRPDRQSWLAAIGWVGRMALTNYILQAALIDYASSPYGLGLKISPVEELMATAILFGLQILLSRLWLSRFRYGPVEWLWRSFTYWRWQPLRIAPGQARMPQEA